MSYVVNPKDVQVKTPSCLYPKDGFCYQLGKEVGRGGQGVVFFAEDISGKIYPGFSRSVTECVIKVGYPTGTQKDRNHPLIKEAHFYNPKHFFLNSSAEGIEADPSVVRMLSNGFGDFNVNGKKETLPYLVLERLFAKPYDHKPSMMEDPSLAISMYANALASMTRIHEQGIVLVDASDDNSMLRLNNPKNGEEYVRQVGAGAYDWVFTDFGCAKRIPRGELMFDSQLVGQLEYLPPEAVKRCKETDRLQTGQYGFLTDVYGLTTSFFRWFMQMQPYEHRNFKGLDLVERLTLVASEQTAPFDLDEIAVIAKELPTRNGKNAADAFVKVYKKGLHPDPSQRNLAKDQLRLVRQLFLIENQVKKQTGKFRFDGRRRPKLKEKLLATGDGVSNALSSSGYIQPPGFIGVSRQEKDSMKKTTSRRIRPPIIQE